MAARAGVERVAGMIELGTRAVLAGVGRFVRHAPVNLVYSAWPDLFGWADGHAGPHPPSTRAVEAEFSVRPAVASPSRPEGPIPSLPSSLDQLLSGQWGS